MYTYKKIYINDKPLILTNAAEQYRQEFSAARGYELFIGAFHRNFRLAKKSLEAPLSTGIIIEDIDIETIEKELKNYFKFIIAAGGVVYNPSGEILMIYRRGKWDLPKGKLDEGESIIECAKREVMEETGIPEVNTGNFICESHHIYTEGKKEILKTTYWYEMHTTHCHALIPQKEENIQQADWIAISQINHLLKQSYNGIKDVLKSAKII